MAGERFRQLGILKRESNPRKEQILAGKVAIITGATGDIGSEIARVFAERGAAVVLNGRRSSDEVAYLQEDIRKRGGRSIFCAADVADEQQAQALVQEAIKQFGHIDILVNNAGIIGEGGGILSTTFDDWNDVVVPI